MGEAGNVKRRENKIRRRGKDIGRGADDDKRRG